MPLLQMAIPESEKVLIRAKQVKKKSKNKPPLQIKVPSDLRYKYKKLPTFAQTSANIRKSIQDESLNYEKAKLNEEINIGVIERLCSTRNSLR